MIRALMLAVLGAASFAGVYYFAAPGEPTLESQAALAPSSEAATDTGSIATAPPDISQSMTFELRPGTEAVPQNAEPARAVRDVTPDNMTAGPKVTGTLARVASPAAAPAPSKARREKFFNAIVISAGMIKARNQEIRLAGIAAPDFEQRCGEGAAAWPCGRMARAALQRFIRGRAVDCEVPAEADKLPDPATCAVGGESVSEWLVAQGWAKRSGEPFEDAEKNAREAKLGLWSEGRPDQASEVASTSG